MKEGYICSECAYKNDAVWPENHVATFHSNKCNFCNKRASLSHTSDYNWPKKKKYLEKNREF